MLYSHPAPTEPFYHQHTAIEHDGTTYYPFSHLYTAEDTARAFEIIPAATSQQGPLAVYTDKDSDRKLVV